MGPLTFVVIALLVLFGLADLGAAIFGKYVGETFSAFDWKLVKNRWWLRVIQGLLIALLFTHLELHIPG